MRSAGAASGSIHGRMEGLNTYGNPRKHFAEWEQRSGFQMIVKGPLTYFFAVMVKYHCPVGNSLIYTGALRVLCTVYFSEISMSLFLCSLSSSPDNSICL